MSEVVEFELSLLDRSTGCTLPCVVVLSSTDSAQLRMSLREHEDVLAEGDDFEEALGVLRSKLEHREQLLLCNRFRREALVTSMSRQMNGGLSCYLVQPRTALDPAQLVECLGAADDSTVVTASEAEVFLNQWKAWFEKPAIVRWARRALG